MSRPLALSAAKYWPAIVAARGNIAISAKKSTSAPSHTALELAIGAEHPATQGRHGWSDKRPTTCFSRCELQLLQVKLSKRNWACARPQRPNTLPRAALRACSMGRKSEANCGAGRWTLPAMTEASMSCQSKTSVGARCITQNCKLAARVPEITNVASSCNLQLVFLNQVAATSGKAQQTK